VYYLNSKTTDNKYKLVITTRFNSTQQIIMDAGV